ncbi:MAG: High-affinity proline transporter PutP [Chlamydiia bacterium]|nr:High-affinity proline transporter PutP [Chlamydiia bacterium]MCH9616080.1 High-affinity proline transporter PutP [Chlamydiia bacterium]MCH9629103.1 High-affinity proline transporter PutP [Chlamydiia bacterium]
MPIIEIIAVTIYCAILFTIGYFSYRRHISSSDYLIGGRSLNYYMTAMAAQASDMSSWLFMAFPALIFREGLFHAWFAVGLAVFMYLNWHFVAPRVRKMTEQYNALTFSSFFESRFADTSGIIRIFTAFMSLLFYSIYISSGLYGLGLLLEVLFDINYIWGITIGICVVIPYLFFGGYKTLAWIDLFQGIFLLIVIAVVPIYALKFIGGFEAITPALKAKDLSWALIPNFEPKTFFSILMLVGGWGLGYFGQPHIVTKFMGIKHVSDVRKAKWVGMSWQIIALFGSTLIGLVAVAFYKSGIADDQLVFVEMVRLLFPPFLAAFVLCAAIAATISTMDSQILVLATNLTEDFYKRIFRKNASSDELVLVSRIAIIFIALFAYAIAFFRISTIYELVFFAWSGLGASFGPLMLFSLYSKRVTKQGAWAGILSGGIIAAIWPEKLTSVPTIIPAFSISAILIYTISLLSKNTHHPMEEHDAHTHH